LRFDRGAINDYPHAEREGYSEDHAPPNYLLPKAQKS